MRIHRAGRARISLHSRTQALRQTLGGLASTGKTVQMTAGWSDFTNPNGVSLSPQQQGAGRRRRPRPRREQQSSAAAWPRCGSAFWTLDPAVAVPSLNIPPRSSPYWAGGLFADPGDLAAMQAAFGGFGLTLNWLFPLAVGG